jgi:UDP-N-acetylmuramate dehydrogenase
VSDAGIRGAAVCLMMMEKVEEAGNGKIIADAGMKLWKLCNFVQKRSLSGLAFAYGIPATVGGAVFMNAGAYDGEMKDVVTTVKAVMPDGTIKEFSKEEAGFAYRHSVFQENGAVILSAEFQLAPGDSGEISAEMERILKSRRQKQPLEYPSAGSAFKRPPGHFAGRLIEEAGLKGFTVGGAQMSEKHAGFIVNKGGATCTDVETLIEKIQERVLESTGVKLESEIKKIE